MFRSCAFRELKCEDIDEFGVFEGINTGGSSGDGAAAYARCFSSLTTPTADFSVAFSGDVGSTSFYSDETLVYGRPSPPTQNGNAGTSPTIMSPSLQPIQQPLPLLQQHPPPPRPLLQPGPISLANGKLPTAALLQPPPVQLPVNAFAAAGAVSKKLATPCSPSSSASPASSMASSPASTSATTTKKKPPPQIGCPDDCAVCGDTSTGYHYDVPSCNGCKTFFRRTLLAQRTFQCKKGGDCFRVLPKEKRCACRACRFDACVAAGMNPLAIVIRGGGGADDDAAAASALADNAMVRAIVAARQRKGGKRPKSEVIEEEDEEAGGSGGEEGRQLSLVPKRIASPNDGMSRLIDSLLYLELRYDDVRRSSWNPRATEIPSLEALFTSSSALGRAHEPMPDWPLNYNRRLSMLPIQEHINQRIKLPKLDYDAMPPNYKMWFFCDLIYGIEYIKTFDFFQKLSTADKAVITRNAVRQCVNLSNSFFSYEKKCDTILYPDGRAPYTNMPRFIPSNCIAVLMRMRLDRTEYVLIKALLLCNPAWDNISPEGRAALTPVRDEYMKSLCDYTLVKRGPVDGPALIVSVVSLIDLLTRQAQKAKESNLLVTALNLRTTPIRLLEDLSSD